MENIVAETRLAKEHELPLLSKLDSVASLTPWSLDSYISSFANPRHKIYVLVEANQVIGAIIVGFALDEAEILQLWIKKELQGKGYGRILLQKIIEDLKKNHILDIFLEVRSDNISAIKLYEKLGFSNVGIRKDYYKVESWSFDAITMQKKYKTVKRFEP